MTTYYLQHFTEKLPNKPERKLPSFIDDKIHDGAEFEKSADAPSWINAKRELGFPLSVAQLLILEERVKREKRSVQERMAA